MLALTLTLATIIFKHQYELDDELAMAIENSDSSTVERLLREGASARGSSVLRKDNVMAVLITRWAHIHVSPDQSPTLWRALEPRRSAGASEGGTGLEIRAQLAIVESLLRHGADPNVRSSDGALPLTIALHSSYSQPRLIQDLISAGADPNLEDEHLLTKNAAGIPSVFRATVNGNYSINLITLMLEHGANVDAADEYGHSSLMLCHKPDIMRLLLARHPDVNRRDIEGLSALDLITADYWESRRAPKKTEREVGEIKRLLVAAGAHR